MADKTSRIIGYDLNWIKVSSDSVVTMGTGCLVDTSAGGFTITLQASPDFGAIMFVGDHSGNASANSIIIDTANSSIEGNTDLVISTDYQGYRFVYNGSEYQRVASAL